MVLHLLLIIENEERRCLMVEKLLEDPEDVTQFVEKSLISNYRLPCNIQYLKEVSTPLTFL